MVARSWPLRLRSLHYDFCAGERVIESEREPARYQPAFSRSSQPDFKKHRSTTRLDTTGTSRKGRGCMSTIQIKHLHFAYDGQAPIFTDAGFDLDTNWHLGLVGRNGYHCQISLDRLKFHELVFEA